MSLDQLISKYLDSELSASEDEQLRSRLSSDAASREEFDTAVHLHMALREDADSIAPGEELLRKTEDEVLMRIMDQKPSSAPPLIIPVREKRRPKLWAVASIAAAFLVAGVFTITDMNDFRYSGGEGSVAESIQAEPVQPGNAAATAETSEDNINNTISNKNIARAESSASGASASANKSAGGVELPPANDGFSGGLAFFNPDFAGQVGAGLERDTDQPKRIITPAPENRSAISASESIAMNRGGHIQQGVSNANAPVNTYLAPGSVLSPGTFDNMLNLEEIHLTTFFGTDLFMDDLGNKQKTLVTNISQSIAYSHTDRIRFGVEAGITKFEYDQEMIVRVPTNEYIGKIEELTSDYIGVPVLMHRNNNMIWAAVFYEQTLMDYSRLSLISRIGVGSSGEGPLGYGRVFGKYRVIGDLYITAGAESRFFMIGLPKELGGKHYRNSISLIYGLQFRL
ncbi:MAG: anti-sigma factor family protein [Candidatus Kapaibacterium sp.]